MYYIKLRYKLMYDLSSIKHQPNDKQVVFLLYHFIAEAIEQNGSHFKHLFSYMYSLIQILFIQILFWNIRWS